MKKETAKMTYEENKLAVVLPVRITKDLSRLIDRQSWAEFKSSAQIVREAVVESLQRKGVKIPDKMTWQKKLEMQAEQRQSDAQATVDNSMFPPLS